MQHKLSDNGLHFIINEECAKDAKGKIKCPLTAYAATKDEEARNIYTIGYGNTHYLNGNPVKKGDVITQEQANELYYSTIKNIEDDLAPQLLHISLSQNEYDAIVSLVYNIGLTAFINSTLLSCLRKGQHIAAAQQFPKWSNQNHKFLQGLYDRRLRERNLFNTPDGLEIKKD